MNFIQIAQPIMVLTAQTDLATKTQALALGDLNNDFRTLKKQS